MSIFLGNLLLISMQLTLMWVTFYQVSPHHKKVPLWWGLSLIYCFINIYLTGIYWGFSLFFFFFFYELIIEKIKSISLIYFISIYTCFIPILILTIASVFIYLISSIIFIKYNEVIWMVASILLAFFIHTSILLISKIKFSILTKNDDFIKKKILIPSNITLTIAFIIFVIPYSTEEVNIPGTQSYNYMIVFLFIYLSLFIGLLLFLSIQAKRFFQREVQKVKEEQYEQLNNYTKEIEGLYQQIRGFRHDFGNILSSLGESIHTGNIENIQQTYDDVLVKANLDLNKKNYDIAELTNISNSAIKSVLSAKMMEAEQKEIHVNVEVKNKIENFIIETLDYVRLISILLDNAIEAAENSSSKKLDLAIFENNNQVVTIISNSRNSEERITIQKLQDPTFSTKGEHRGTGLQNVKQIVEKYSNVTIDTKIKDSEFIQTLIFTRKE